MKKYIVFLMILSSVQLFSQEKITTSGGKHNYGYVIDETNTHIFIRDHDGVESRIPKDFIVNRERIYSEIIMINGKKYEGHIKRITKDKIYVLLENSSELELNQSEIKSYEYHSTTQSGYPAFGATIGTPGILNLVGYYNFSNNLQLRIQGGGLSRDDPAYTGYYSDEVMTGGYGLQVNFGYLLSVSDHFEHCLSLSLGYMELYYQDYNYYFGKYSYDYDWGYVGLNYNINWGGFFAEIGLSAGEGDFSNPQLMIQLGYVYRFTN